MKRKHVIIGGGSSGLVVARKLAATDYVVLVERGTFLHKSSGSSSQFEEMLNIYAQLNVWCFRSFASELAERVHTVPQAGLHSRVVSYAQGTGGGGSGDVNAMIYTLGSRLVYDQLWPEPWNSKQIESILSKVFKYFQPRRMQSSGHVRDMLVSGAEPAPAKVMDQCGYVPEYYASIATSGTDRLSQVQACFGSLIPENLTVLEKCRVRRLVFQGDTATGVIVERQSPDGTIMEETISPEHGGEIVLCAGVFEAPRILVASGLREGTADIPPLPDIGHHVQDHVVLPYMLLANWHQGWDLFHPQGTPSYAGKPAYPLNGIHGWVNLTEQGEVWDESTGDAPRMQLLFIDGRVSSSIIPMMLPRFGGSGFYMRVVYPALFAFLQWVTAFSLVRWLCGCFFGVLVCVTQPYSRGRLHVNTSRPSGPLAVDPGYLQDQRDVDMLQRGLRTARALAQRQRERKTGFSFLEIFPGPLFAFCRNQGWFEFYARTMATTYFHACGTCRMGSAGQPGRSGEGVNAGIGREAEASGQSLRTGVVDEQLRVHGVRGLRIADASVIPAIPSSPTHAICMVIGEACGDLVQRADGSK